MKLLEVHTFTKNFTPLQRIKPSKILGESNHKEQESFSEQEKFVQMEITFTLRENGGYKISGLGGR